MEPEPCEPPCDCGWLCSPLNFKFSWVDRFTVTDPDTFEVVELEIQREFTPKVVAE